MSSRKRNWLGVTLIELLVVLVILSTLAAVVIPQAEVMVRRDKELELRRNLRTMRDAIDRFHADWEAGEIDHDDDYASEDGYPVTLEVLVEGVPSTTVGGNERYYLRRIPPDPFGEAVNREGHQWVLRSYQDPPDTRDWGGQDVYDVRTNSEKRALNGTHYNDW